MRVFHEAAHPEIVRRINADAPPAIGKFQRLHDLQITPPLPQPPNSGLLQHFNEWLRGAVQDRQFQRVQLDVDVVHAAGIERGEQVLGGGEQHALLHQAGGVADARDVSHMRFDLKIVEVHAPEHDSGIGRGRHKPQVGFYGGVEADSLGGNRPFDRGLIAHVCLYVAC